jgi:hypothetical protein
MTQVWDGNLYLQRCGRIFYTRGALRYYPGGPHTWQNSTCYRKLGLYPRRLHEQLERAFFGKHVGKCATASVNIFASVMLLLLRSLLPFRVGILYSPRQRLGATTACTSRQYTLTSTQQQPLLSRRRRCELVRVAWAAPPHFPPLFYIFCCSPMLNPAEEFEVRTRGLLFASWQLN